LVLYKTGEDECDANAAPSQSTIHPGTQQPQSPTTTTNQNNTINPSSNNVTTKNHTIPAPQTTTAQQNQHRQQHQQQQRSSDVALALKEQGNTQVCGSNVVYVLLYDSMSCID